MESRERVLEAAVDLMSREGIAALSMREVARRAGLSHQAPYHHFRNREGILAAIAEDGFRRLNQRLEAVSGRNAAARMIAGGRAYVDFALSHPAHFQVMFRPELVDLEKYPSARAEAGKGFSILQFRVDQLVREKLIPRRHAAGMVTLSWAFVQGLSSLLLEGPLARATDGDIQISDRIESAFDAFAFLISGGGRKTHPTLT